MTRDEIIAANPIVEILRARGIKLTQHGENFVTNRSPAVEHKQAHTCVEIYPANNSWFDHDLKIGGSIIDWLILKSGGDPKNKDDVRRALEELAGSRDEEPKIVATFNYKDEQDRLLYQVCRFEPGFHGKKKDFKARRDPSDTQCKRGIKGVRRVLYRLSEVIAAKQVIIVEGEKNVEQLRALGFIATTNPFGAGKWRDEYNKFLKYKDVVVFGDIGDKDGNGEKHTQEVIASLRSSEIAVRHGLQPAEFHDIGDLIESIPAEERKNAVHKLILEAKETAASVDDEPANTTVTLEDFYSYMPMHKYIFTETREMWPSSSVNNRLPPVGKGDDAIAASVWLDKNRPVETMTWAPGSPMLIEDRLISDGGWIERHGCKTFNLYRPPNIALGDPNKAGKWLDHVNKIYPNDATHLIEWLAQRVQRPNEKINHALFLGGAQGIGKDTLLYPVRVAVGPWNVHEILPPTLLMRFNGFTKSVLLCINEAHDLGDLDRYAFYERLKAYTAAPPDVIRVDEKNLREYVVPNVCGVVLTSNYKTSGLYLPADDRRHYIAWSDKNRSDFSDEYWRNIYAWYRLGGCRHVAAYLAQFDLSDFNPKAPPPKTNAFWEIVDSNCAPENAELADALAQLDNPDAVTIRQVVDVLPDSNEFRYWLKDRKNARQIPHRFEECGYVAVRNPDEKAGRWKIGSSSHVIYAKKTLSISEQIVAAKQCIENVKSLYQS